jgi:phosphatidylserine/phosphatidylglycerophosphate/cardiolipin synthase-like enzyme
VLRDPRRIPTFIDTAHTIAHNKIVIIDGTRVITGSFNFTRSAEEKNAENLLIIRSEDLAVLYKDNGRNTSGMRESWLRGIRRFTWGSPPCDDTESVFSGDSPPQICMIDFIIHRFLPSHRRCLWKNGK